MDYVKFIRGSQTAYDSLKTQNKINQDTLYFIYDKTNLESTGKLYLGTVLISDDAANELDVSFNIVDDQLSNGQVLVYKDGIWENCDVSSLNISASKPQIFKVSKTDDTTDAQLLATLTTAVAGDFAVITYTDHNISYVKKDSEWLSLSQTIEQLTGDEKSIDINDNSISIHGFNEEYYQWDDNSSTYVKTTGFTSGLELKSVETSPNVFEVGWYQPNLSTVEGLSSSLAQVQTDLANKVDKVDGSRLITSAEVSKLESAITQVNTSQFTITDGVLNLNTTIDFSSTVGNMSELVHASGESDSTLIDEINYINERLAWKDLD